MPDAENFTLEQLNKKILAARPAEQKPIGQDVCNWLGRITRNTKKNGNVVSLLEQIIGVEMMRHCSVESIRGGMLKIKAEPGPCMFQLKNISGEILRKVQMEIPAAKIREIKIVIN